MKSDSSEPQTSLTAPSEDRLALALRESAVVMAPIARWLVRNGVSYGAFADMLKSVFVAAARVELERAGSKASFSSLSVLSGVHRKDVRALENEAVEPGSATPHRGIPIASKVFTRWLTVRRYRSRDGEPKSLPRTGPGATFETLAREVSVDVHPRTVLEELLRLELVQLDGDVVVPVGASFTPSRKLDEITTLVAHNAADHLSAAVHNLTIGRNPFLEQSVFADGLSEDSIQVLHQMARDSWNDAFQALVTEATHCVDEDANLDEPMAQHRMRFGVYFYSEPQAPADPEPEVSTPKRRASTKAPERSTRTRRTR